MNESDPRWGVTKYPFLECLREGILPVYTKFGKYPFFGTLGFGVPRTGSKPPPVGDCSSSWLLWHDEKTTSDVKTTNGPDLLKLTYVINIPQGLNRLLLHIFMIP